MALRWNENLAVGVSWIDEEHKQLFRRINSLTESMSRGEGTKEVKELVVFLKKYTVEHFGNEEREMKAKNYPKFEAHKRQHELFIEQVNKIMKALDQEGLNLTLTLKVQDFMNKWWVNHINKVDKALGQFLME